MMRITDTAKGYPRHTKPRYTMFLAVLPAYRKTCIEYVRETLGDQVQFIVSDAHLDPTVKTGIPEEYYRRATIWRLFSGRLFVQFSNSLAPLASEAVIVDLNPRSLSAWGLLILRRILRRRTLVWGHIHPQAGPGSWTGKFRKLMRRLAHGTISYTYEDRAKALSDLPRAAVWVAPNALYRRADMIPAAGLPEDRTDVLYVGRFVPAKKLPLLLRGFALASADTPSMGLKLIGGGPDESAMRLLAAELGIAGKVAYCGWEDEVSALRSAYQSAFCTVSPGFAGLGLTQSLGFGVPMLVADRENHSPEIELQESGGVDWFTADSPEALADRIKLHWGRRHTLPNLALSEYTRQRYSAEAMASGLIAALGNDKSVEVGLTKDLP